MTWINRLRLLVGLVVIVVIVAAATIILNQRESQVASASASIEALSYSVGSDYPGIVVAQSMKQGEKVTKGEPLMTIQSPTLTQALASTTITVPTSTAYTVTDDGMLSLLATETGVISKIDASVGAFVGAGQSLATVDRGEGMYVRAEYHLEPYNFARVEKGAKADIILPDHTRLAGEVTDVRVSTVDGRADADLTIGSKNLKMGAAGGLVMSGTPVTAMLHLKDEGPLAGLRGAWLDFLEQIGV
ncbi:HlyD family efflux transporter periplasmic adaptor subunit [Rathayibacter sp. YIM 133350]|uniref:HlyD family efflux transporter periplasmic adaptor subunit n=1 Tax=Rathayibacter sp. YIM 133350 TaxID=3131992 RepID=UPI00307D9034